MKNKLILVVLVIILVFAITACSKNVENDNNNASNKKEVISTLRVVIDEKEYIVKLNDNKTSKSFIKLLPQELNMSDLNCNEKYAYLDNKLPVNSYNPKRINKGDVMLFGNNCLVIFYKSFDTSYSYTKIGHIDNLPDLGNGDVLVKFKK